MMERARYRQISINLYVNSQNHFVQDRPRRNLRLSAPLCLPGAARLWGSLASKRPRTMVTIKRVPTRPRTAVVLYKGGAVGEAGVEINSCGLLSDVVGTFGVARIGIAGSRCC